MTITVGRIPYLSCEPFYFDMERRGIALTDLTPRALAAAAERGEIDAGLVPLGECFRLEERFRLLSGFCLSTIRKSISVALHAKKPIQDLAGARIGVPDEAVTSLQLLRLLLSMKYEVQPEAYVTLADPPDTDAVLLIGNQGLRRRYRLRGYPHLYDLGEEWFEWTGLPFVFAHWVVRNDLEGQALVQLEESLYAALQDWADGLFHFSASRDDLAMDSRDMLAYTQGIRYFAGRPEQQAIERFRTCLAHLDAG
jgi:chorismate dehydratase